MSPAEGSDPVHSAQRRPGRRTACSGGYRLSLRRIIGEVLDAEGFGATDEDVDSRIQQDFDEAQFDRVRALLEQVETAVPEHSVRRVQVAALILAEGDVGVLEHYVNQARIDFRDVLTPAFYPQQ